MMASETRCGGPLPDFVVIISRVESEAAAGAVYRRTHTYSLLEKIENGGG